MQNIFLAINKVIFEKDNVDLNHTYINGTKIEVNANKYTWVWKKSCITNRNKIFGKGYRKSTYQRKYETLKE